MYPVKHDNVTATQSSCYKVYIVRCLNRFIVSITTVILKVFPAGIPVKYQKSKVDIIGDSYIYDHNKTCSQQPNYREWVKLFIVYKYVEILWVLIYL